MPHHPYQLLRSTFSDANLRRLFDDRVSGSLAVGRDGIRVDAFRRKTDQEIDAIRRKVTTSSYKFTRYKETLISKGAKKPPRVLSIPTVRDRLTLRALHELLNQVFKDAQTKKPHSFIKEIKERLVAEPSNDSFVRIDIKDYYPSINADLLMRIVRRRVRKRQILHLLDEAIRTPTGDSLLSNGGVPQGLSVSNILSSIYLNDVDERMRRRWDYYRYVDDILITCPSDKALAAYEEVREALESMGLSCHALGDDSGKTYITSTQRGAEYLGYQISRDALSVRHSSVVRMFATIQSVLTAFKYRRSQERLVWRLNLKVTGCTFGGVNYGWMFFFSQTEDKRQLARLDNFVKVHMRKRKLGHLLPGIKRFVKTYHEIRHNMDCTRYIPNFDAFSIGDMKETLISMGSRDAGSLDQMDEAAIRSDFYRRVKREVTSLERDLIEAFS